jgi:hypothetical protein
MKIFLVIRASGDYDDYKEEPQRAFIVKKKAEDYSFNLNNQNKKDYEKYRKLSKKFYDIPWQDRINLERPETVTAYFYSVQEIELDDSI